MKLSNNKPKKKKSQKQKIEDRGLSSLHKKVVKGLGFKNTEEIQEKFGTSRTYLTDGIWIDEYGNTYDDCM